MRRDRQRSTFTRRALVIGGVQTAAFAALSARLYTMSVTHHRRYEDEALGNAEHKRPLAPERGLILDRSGIVLAANPMQWRVMFLMTATKAPGATLRRLNGILNLSTQKKAALAKLIAGPPHRVPVLVKKGLDWREMARLEEHKPELPGVIVDQGYGRAYPLGSLAAHTVGYVVPPDPKQVKQHPVLKIPGSRIGGGGVEKSMNAALTGKPGEVVTEVNAGGRTIRVLGKRAPEQGRTVRLTLDAPLQRVAMTALGNRPGAVALMDVETGALRAMASTPSFDPAWFDKGIPERIWKRWMSKSAHHPLTDRTTNGLYAPGSSFKPTAALAALKCGAITGGTTIFCPGHLKIGDRIFYCWKRSGHGWMDVVSAIQQSCDVFFYHVALRTGIDHMAAMGARLGLTGSAPIEFPDIATSFLPTRKWAADHHVAWTKGDTAVQGIGQGYTVLTPLALVTMMARLATARRVAPHLIEAVGDAPTHHGKPARLDVASEHLALVRHGLFEVVNTRKGTAWGGRMSMNGMVMAGKTGTAQVEDDVAEAKARGRNHGVLPWKDRPNALFVGYAPLDRPKFAAAVVIEHGTLLGPVKVARSVFEAAITGDKPFQSVASTSGPSTPKTTPS